MANYGYDKSIVRLTKVLTRLNKNEALSVSLIALDFKVDERTIYRDIKELSSYFPIYKVKNKWIMKDNFRFTRDSEIEEAIVLLKTINLLESAGPVFACKAKIVLNNTSNFFYIKDI